MTQDEHIELLQMKDEELDGLKTEIMKEQQVNSHIQMIQVGERPGLSVSHSLCRRKISWRRRERSPSSTNS